MSVVFLGIGAAKAGTSWLHAQMAQHPDCHFRSLKELHYFDAVDSGRLDSELERHQTLQVSLTERAAGAPNPAQARRLADRADWLSVLQVGREDTTAYLSYLGGGNGQTRVVGEITPSYVLLSQARLGAMATMAPDVRMLYLIRDPVERLWSHVRMIAGRRDPNGRVTPERAGNILQRVLRGEEDQIARRGDYATALTKLETGVPAGRVMVGIFEEMVAPGGLDPLAEYLEISPFEGDAVPIHEGQPLDMSREQRRAAEDYLAPQYRAVEERLGRLPAEWRRKGV